ncbi:hypothetical protein LPJ63_002904 [Coemansia sp. RSA 2711]|nr:hypothetical protein LPJ63_002904 [Coemansia sp. RSA 2711]KAJ2303237.1 hypothetical protein IWW54_005789 [Coemansia sp. RSA 2705]KAJ2320166.1 hypothetical protein IWW51_004698 [Coemansia sp. RSA 2702]KAJ2368976.1 hypothetical protein H4S01_001281 [Coemansia sp. RSA 2610]KAJ2392257.1 hypothetical protein H4S02_000882 [Coemansia sp. RSA 2611]KAJ2715872.1 hypothetical protein H4R23_005536 [Coemansia sp. Cherry 401B]
MDPTPAPEDNGGQADEFASTDANQVSVVAVLCGTAPCDADMWNNFRLIDRSSVSSEDDGSTDLGPLYRPQTTAEESVDEALAHDKHTNRYALPIAVAIPVAAVLAFVVLYSVYRRNRRAKHHKEQGGDEERGPYGQLDSGEPSPATSETFDYNHQPIARRMDSSNTAGSNRTSLFTAATPPPLPYRGSSHYRHSTTPPPLPPRSPDAVQPPADMPRSPALRTEPDPRFQAALEPAGAQRIRANTFSDVPSDDLPPYVDPIDEALAAASRPASLDDDRLSRRATQSPPPYDTITLPDRAQLH